MMVVGFVELCPVLMTCGDELLKVLLLLTVGSVRVLLAAREDWSQRWLYSSTLGLPQIRKHIVLEVD